MPEDNHCEDNPIPLLKRQDAEIKRTCGTCFWRTSKGLCEAVYNIPVDEISPECTYHVTEDEATRAGVFKPIVHAKDFDHE